MVFHEERGKKSRASLAAHSMKSKTGLARERSVALFYEELERKRGFLKTILIFRQREHVRNFLFRAVALLSP